VTEASERSFAPWTPGLLARVSTIAVNDATEWQSARPIYRGRWLGSVLVQGAARHLVRPGHGVKDIDVLALYANPNPPGHRGHGRRRAQADLGPSRFGVHPLDAQHGYTGRRVDLLVRDLPVAPRTGLADALVPWLAEAAAACSGTFLGAGQCSCGKPHRSGWYWAQSPVIALAGDRLGSVIWSGTGVA